MLRIVNLDVFGQVSKLGVFVPFLSVKEVVKPRGTVYKQAYEGGCVETAYVEHVPVVHNEIPERVQLTLS